MPDRTKEPRGRKNITNKRTRRRNWLKKQVNYKISDGPLDNRV